MLFINKYNPTKIDDCFFHKKTLSQLKIISNDKSIPHIIFHGPRGSGKKTIIKLFLQMLYGEDVNKIVTSTYVISGSGNSSISVSVKKSNYHIIIEPNNNNFDKYLVQNVVKEYAKKIPLNIFKTNKSFKTVLINNIDEMSYYAQTSLRRTMEKYSDTCRFIMWSRSLTKVIDPLRSRCLCFRIQNPSNSELFERLYKISVKEKIDINLNVLNQILDKSNGSIKKSLWLLQLFQNSHKFDNNYDTMINKIVNLLLENNINNITQIRLCLYNLMITNINGTEIIKSILENIILNKKIPETCIYKILKQSAIYEHNLVRGRRDIIHLDALMIKIITILYKDDDFIPEYCKN